MNKMVIMANKESGKPFPRHAHSGATEMGATEMGQRIEGQRITGWGIEF